MKPRYNVRILFVLTTIAATTFAGVVWVKYLLAPHRMLIAAEKGDEAEVRRFLQSGVKPTSRDGWGGTAMMYASSNGHVNILRPLLDFGADVNERSRLERTPLIWAARNGQLAAAKFLLDHGAAHDLADRDGLTAAAIAEIHGYDCIVALIEKIDSR